MITEHRFKLLAMAILAAACLAGHAQAQVANAYGPVNLISNVSGAAIATDPLLVNPWGLAFIPGAPFWVADQGNGLATTYDGGIDVLGDVIEFEHNGLGHPMGIIWNPTLGFPADGPGTFIVACSDGLIEYQVLTGGTTVSTPTPVTAVDNSGSGAVYTSLIQLTAGPSTLLLTTNFHSGAVEAYDTSFNPVNITTAFEDPSLPAGYAPYGIWVVDGDVFISYALQDADAQNPVPGAGNGYIDLYSAGGTLLSRFASGNPLNAPWAVVRAPFGFGKFAGDILVGNTGDGRILVYSPKGEHLGALRDVATGNVIKISGLHGLIFGGGQLSDADVLYFTAAPSGATQGLYGTIQAESD